MSNDSETTKPWERQRDESGELEPMRWFGRFSHFRQMGASRSLLECVNRYRDEQGQKRSNNVPGSWRRAEEKWSWRERVARWDQHEIDRQADLFQERADAWRANRFEDAEKLREKANELLRLPVIKRTGVDQEGQPYIVEAVPPATLRAAAGILKTADELARITTRETLPTTGIGVELSGEIGIDHSFERDLDKVYGENE